MQVLSVLRSGGPYDASWVHALKKAVEKHLSIPHEFLCLSDVEIDGIETIRLWHDWPGWWAKIELFRPGLIEEPTLYLDLDTVIVGSIDDLTEFPEDFASMRNFNAPHMIGSAVMWFKKAPTEVYEAFAENPDFWMREYSALGRHGGTMIGDQAVIWEVMGRQVPFLTDYVPGLIRSYRRHCMAGIPVGCSLIAFGGPLKPNTVQDEWVKEHWCH